MADTENNDPVSQLDERLAHLEALTAPSLLALNTDGRDQLQGSLLRSLQGIQEKLSRFTEERRAIGEFLQKHGQIRDLLQNEDDELAHMSLDNVTKRDILLASEEDLIYHAADLKQIGTMKAELESPILQGLEAMIPKLSEIEAQHVRQSHTEAAARARLSRTLNSYNALVSCLSDVFILYEDMVSDMEMRVLQWEKQLE
ncbi:hypothetical protein DFJ77DRAFT_320646 [Powellomyces hirtus]|nr:hypothetical protein DFJ77DRAFT_320646 [Powellomyces hirtus]